MRPFGADHLLAMLAVCVWSVSALPANKAWQGPATFLLALMISAYAGHARRPVPYLEHGVSLSVVLLGGMLLLAHRSALPPVIGLGLTAAASLQGWRTVPRRQRAVSPATRWASSSLPHFCKLAASASAWASAAGWPSAAAGRWVAWARC